MPAEGGVQVLPVQWRQKIDFGKRKKEATPKKAETEGSGKASKSAEEGEEATNELIPNLEDITLEGVPSIRMLVSDVVLDVLLYMTPAYRQEMIKHVVEELNRIYRSYKARNPKFNGKVSIYGHSLGSLLAFDILCSQPYSEQAEIPQIVQERASKPHRHRSEVDLSDMLRNAISSKNDKKVSGLMEKTQNVQCRLDFKVDKLFGELIML
jgi:hypothetical protein